MNQLPPPQKKERKIQLEFDNKIIRRIQILAPNLIFLKKQKNDLQGYTHAYTPTHTHIVSLASFRPDESLRNNFF